MSNLELSKFLSYILRHHPEEVDLSLDNEGYLKVKDLIYSINNKSKFSIDFNLLKEIVETNNKKRYEFSNDFSKIRARQGHSLKVDVGLKEVIPPEYLFHGTSTRFLDSILKNGILKMSRTHVHLSKDIETAQIVGKRHGKPVVLKINTKQLSEKGQKFYISKNDVYLTKDIDPKYIEVI